VSFACEFPSSRVRQVCNAIAFSGAHSTEPWIIRSGIYFDFNSELLQDHNCWMIRYSVISAVSTVDFSCSSHFGITDCLWLMNVEECERNDFIYFEIAVPIFFWIQTNCLPVQPVRGPQWNPVLSEKRSNASLLNRPIEGVWIFKTRCHTALQNKFENCASSGPGTTSTL